MEVNDLLTSFGNSLLVLQQGSPNRAQLSLGCISKNWATKKPHMDHHYKMSLFVTNSAKKIGASSPNNKMKKSIIRISELDIKQFLRLTNRETGLLPKRCFLFNHSQLRIETILSCNLISKPDSNYKT